MGLISCKLIKILGAREKVTARPIFTQAKASRKPGWDLILKRSITPFIKRKSITVFARKTWALYLRRAQNRQELDSVKTDRSNAIDLSLRSARG